MEWAPCKVTILTDFSGEILPWTASSTNTWENQPILPCLRLACMQGNSFLRRATTGTNLLYRRGEVLSAPRVLLVLKRSFMVSLSSLDVLNGSRLCVVCFVWVLFCCFLFRLGSFLPFFVSVRFFLLFFCLVQDIQSIAFSPVLQKLVDQLTDHATS